MNQPSARPEVAEGGLHHREPQTRHDQQGAGGTGQVAEDGNHEYKYNIHHHFVAGMEFGSWVTITDTGPSA